jgi:hypothetical protein
MNIQVAVLCDAATAENDKLNLLGAFDTIITQQLPTQLRPAVHPQCAVAVRVTFMPGDEGPHQLAINLINADGRSIMPHFPHISFEVVLPEDLHFVTRNFTASFQHSNFPSPACIPWTSGSTTSPAPASRCWSNTSRRAKACKFEPWPN